MPGLDWQKYINVHEKTCRFSLHSHQFLANENNVTETKVHLLIFLHIEKRARHFVVYLRTCWFTVRDAALQECTPVFIIFNSL